MLESVNAPHTIQAMDCSPHQETGHLSSNVSQIPEEVWLQILKYIPPVSHGRVSLTCRFFARLLKDQALPQLSFDHISSNEVMSYIKSCLSVIDCTRQVFVLNGKFHHKIFLNAEGLLKIDPEVDESDEIDFFLFWEKNNTNIGLFFEANMKSKGLETNPRTKRGREVLQKITVDLFFLVISRYFKNFNKEISNPTSSDCIIAKRIDLSDSGFQGLELNDLQCGIYAEKIVNTDSEHSLIDQIKKSIFMFRGYTERLAMEDLSIKDDKSRSFC